MDYKKLYEEALERAKKIHNEHKAQPFNAMTKVFPELAESEDEKIRKALIEMFISIGKRDFRDIPTKKIIAWLEKQGKQPIYKTPSREIILAIWDLGNEWKELTKGSISTEYGTQLDYIQKHWRESEYYLRAKQSEQKPFDYESANIQKKDFAPESTPRYSIGDVLCDKSCTTLNKESQPNFEIIDIRNGMYVCDKCSFPISQQDEYELVAKRIEQKPADKVEPKFHEGEWITNGDYTWKIVEVKPLDYILQSQDGNIVDDTISHVDEQFHSFTIEDAKEGDILASELCDSIILFKGIENNNIQFYCDYNFSEINVSGNRFAINNGCQHYGSVEDSEDFHPATKEQCDTLTKAMTDAGYKLDSDNKRLLSLKAEPNSEQKTAEWSEEDERKYEGIRSCIYNCCALTNAEYLCNWLETQLSK